MDGVPARVRSVGAWWRAEPWLMAVEVAWYLVVLGGVLTGQLAGYGPRGRIEFHVLIVVAVTCAAFAVSRWWRPEWTAAAAIVTSTVGIVVLLVRPIGPLGPLRQMLSLAVGPILVAATVRRSRVPVAVVVVALAVVAGAVDTQVGGLTLSTDLVRLLTGRDPRGSLQIVPVAAFVVLAPVAAGLALRSSDSARRAAGLARLRLEERLGVARELHDMVANHITGIILTAQAAGLPDGIPPSTSQALTSIESAGDRALGAMRRMVATLRAGDLVDLPAVPSDQMPDGSAPGSARTPLDAVREAIGDDARVHLRHPDSATDAEAHPEVVTTLHRLVVEGLTNARRHMPDGAAADVELVEPRPGALVVQITNERGRGPSRTRGGGFGLVGLVERVDAVGGRIVAGPMAPHHWRVRAELPCWPDRGPTP